MLSNRKSIGAQVEVVVVVANIQAVKEQLQKAFDYYG